MASTIQYLYLVTNKSVTNFLVSVHHVHNILLGSIQGKEKIKRHGSYLKELTVLYF